MDASSLSPIAVKYVWVRRTIVKCREVFTSSARPRPRQQRRCSTIIEQTRSDNRETFAFDVNQMDWTRSSQF